MKKVLVTGSKGQLGSEIEFLHVGYPRMGFEFHDKDTLDLANIESLEKYFETNRPDFVINCAAYTAVDRAEEDQEGAMLLNAGIPQNLVKLCNEHNTKIIHISTDYVFNGKGYKPYTEEDIPDPVSFYGKSKFEGEKAILKAEKGMIIRTSWLYSSFGNNFIKTVIRLGQEKDEIRVINDQIGTPTYARDLAQAILKIVSKSIESEDFFKTGIYHYSNEGVCSWYDLAIEIMNYSRLNCFVLPIESKDYPLPAKRPYYSVLNKKKLKSTFNIQIPYWKNSLYYCLDILLDKNK